MAGFVELAFSAMAQTLVQINAPPAKARRPSDDMLNSPITRPRIAGVTVGLLGGMIGIHWSLALSALALLVLAGAMLAWQSGRARA